MNRIFMLSIVAIIGCSLLYLFLFSCTPSKAIDDTDPCTIHSLPIPESTSKEIIVLYAELDSFHRFMEDHPNDSLIISERNKLLELHKQINVVQQQHPLLAIRAGRLLAFDLTNRLMLDSAKAILFQLEEDFKEKEMGSKWEAYELAYIYNLLGIIAQYEYDIPLSIFYHKKGLSIDKAFDILSEAYKEYSNICLGYYYLGDVDRAYLYSDSMLMILKDYGGDIICTREDSTAYAVNYFHRGKLKSIEFYNLSLVGDTMAARKALHESINAFQLSLQSLQEVSGYHANELIHLYYNYGSILTSAEEPVKADSAIYYLKKCLNIAPGHPMLKMLTYPQMAVTYAKFGRCQQAKPLIDTIATLIPTNPEHARGIIQVVFTALMENAKAKFFCYKQGGDETMLASINADFETALTFYEGAQRIMGSDEAIEAYSGNFFGYYSTAFDAAYVTYKLKKQEENFETLLQLCDRGKAVNLYHNINQNKALKEWTGDALKLLQQDINLRAKINDNQIGGGEMLDKATLEREAFIKRLQQSNNPIERSYYYNRLNVPKVSLAEVRSKLCPKGTAVVSYQHTQGKSYALVVTPRKDTVFELDTDKAFYDQLVRYRESLTGDDIPIFRSSAYPVYQTIFKEIHEWLPVDINHITLVWGRMTQGLVFESLLTKAYEGSLDKAPFLKNQLSFTYNYSLASLLVTQEMHQYPQTLKPMGIFLNTGPSTCGGELSNLYDMTHTLGKSHCKGQAMIKEMPTISEFMGQAQEYNVLLLSMHGCKPPNQQEEEAHLAFSTDQDGEVIWLSPAMVQSMALQTQLTVLATCENAKGRNMSSEGRKSLARAFLYAGSAAVIASNEEVPEVALIELMDRTFKHAIEDQLKISKALNMAKQELQQSKPHPHYWANVILMGDPFVILDHF